MNNSKEKMLHRIRTALKDIPENEVPDDVKVERDYIRNGDLDPEERVELFVERCGEYRATVKRIRREDIMEEIGMACQRHNAVKIAVPAGFKKEWLPGALSPHLDDPTKPLTHDELDQLDGVITTCALAVAQTGTIVLDAGEGQGRRVLTLLPDLHLCIVREDQIVETIPEAFTHFDEVVKKEARPITFISGPSATSDIELSRVEGVHGPRRLEVLVVRS